MTNDWMIRSRCSASSLRSSSLKPRPAQSTSNRRTIEWREVERDVDVTDSMWGFGRPGTMSRPRCLSFGSHSSAVAIASATASTGSVMPRRCVASRSRKSLGGVHGGRHEQGVGAGEVPVDRLAGDAERAGDVGDGEVGAAGVDRLARRVEDPRDGFVVAGGRRARPAVGAHAGILLLALVGDREPLDAVEPSRPKPLRLRQFRDVRDLVGDLVEDQLDLHAGQVGADAEVRAVAAEAEMRVGVAQDVELERAGRRRRRRSWRSCRTGRRAGPRGWSPRPARCRPARCAGSSAPASPSGRSRRRRSRAARA